MPIKLLELPDPLSRISLSAVTEVPPTADSTALTFLYQEMQRYCKGQVSGRSFLISGHRGAGKTTLVSSAFRKVRKDVEKGGMVRPLLVLMNGTALLPPLSEEPAPPISPETWTPGSQKTEPAAGGSQQEAKGALEQITLCLYRALAREVAQEFWKRNMGHFPIGRRERHQLEIAAQLESELHQAQAPEAARLRELWRRGGLLHSVWWRGGLVRSEGLFSTAPWLVSQSFLYRTTPGQGLRELVALASAAAAFRRISGQETQEDKSRNTAEDSRETAIGLQAVGKELLDSLLVLLTGGLAGAGTLAGGIGAVPAALAGLATALAAAAFFKVTRSSSRKSARSFESTFLADTSIETLDRVLPILVDRILDAGLAPIFVVDELDKVQDLARRMGGLVRYLKKLVAEQAFFCFLTDRDYFEEVRRQGTRATYSVEYTYFTHQLYVVYSADQLHHFLDDVLVRPEPLRRQTPAAQTSLASADVEAKEREQSEELADYPLLSYLLLYRSRMHMLDLRRELARLTDDSGNFGLKRGQVRSDPYRLEVFYQVAVEMILAQDEITRRIEQSPPFLRLVHDALYYLARRWTEEQDLDFGAQGREPFKAHMLERAGLAGRRDRSLTLCSEEDLAVLFNSACKLATWLADWNLFEAEFGAWSARRRLDSIVEEVLHALRAARLPPLRRVGLLRFEWQYSPLGEERRDKGPQTWGAAVEDLTLPTGWEDDAHFIERIATFFGDLSGPQSSVTVDLTTLSTQLRILNTSPAWSEAQRAIKALRQASREQRSYPEAARDTVTVGEFVQLLLTSGDLLAVALAWGARIGRVARQGDRAERLLVGLRLLSVSHRFAEKTREQIIELLRGLESQIPPAMELSPVGSIPGILEFEDWIRWVQSKLTEADSLSISEAHLRSWEESSWALWKERLGAFVRGLKVTAPELVELFGAAAERGPTQLLDFRLEAMSLGAWTTALLMALSRQVPSVPDWLAQFALAALGFNPWAFDFKKFAPSSSFEPNLIPRREEPELSAVLMHSAPSRIEFWLPDKSCAAISVSEEQARNLRPLIQQLIQELVPDWLVVDELFDAKLAESLKLPSMSGPLPLLREPRAVLRRDGGIVAPKSFGEFADYLRSLPRDATEGASSSGGR